MQPLSEVLRRRNRFFVPYDEAHPPSPIVAPAPSVYLSGPMTGYDDLNKPAFDAAKDRLALFFPWATIISPPDLGEFAGGTWEAYLKRDIHHVVEADALVALQWWRDSKGASLEVEVEIAHRVGIPVFRERDYEPVPYVAPTSEISST